MVLNMLKTEDVAVENVENVVNFVVIRSDSVADVVVVDCVVDAVVDLMMLMLMLMLL